MRLHYIELIVFGRCGVRFSQDHQRLSSCRVLCQPEEVVFYCFPIGVLRTALADHQVTSDSLPEELYFKRIHVFYIVENIRHTFVKPV
ncbi:COPII coat assembly protein sec16 [Frankliniella fusca]|uniref:COPII coat assembly protein sec16 n=1 Tax=Frankliniella fusca TaxID=407009 RepID=A0AAE1GW64_9NEOP|nr:COPII coat assembly protein sec16 [Frankliniella fusca]